MSWAARRGPGRAGVPQRPLVPQVFQCLLIEGENSGEGAVREAERFLISDAEFEAFLDRHREVSCLVPESNQKVGARALDIRDRTSRWAGRGRSGARRGEARGAASGLGASSALRPPAVGPGGSTGRPVTCA